MTREQLIKAMLDDAHSEVVRNGYRFSVVAEDQLKEIITSGVNRMSVQELVSLAKTAEARNNTKIFIRRICDKHRREHTGIIVENRTFSEARMSICPMWPLC